MPRSRAQLLKQARIIAKPALLDDRLLAIGELGQRIGKLDDCIAYGPGIRELAHQPDEYMAIEDLVASAKVMALATLRLLGVLPS